MLPPSLHRLRRDPGSHPGDHTGGKWENFQSKSYPWVFQLEFCCTNPFFTFSVQLFPQPAIIGLLLCVRVPAWASSHVGRSEPQPDLRPPLCAPAPGFRTGLSLSSLFLLVSLCSQCVLLCPCVPAWQPRGALPHSSLDHRLPGLLAKQP